MQIYFCLLLVGKFVWVDAFISRQISEHKMSPGGLLEGKEFLGVADEFGWLKKCCCFSIFESSTQKIASFCQTYYGKITCEAFETELKRWIIFPFSQYFPPIYLYSTYATICSLQF